MTNILKISILVSTILVPTLVKAQATSPLEVSSTVIPGCFIEADNINFGNLIMPLINQSSQSNMNIKCSKNTSLNISISYSNSTISSFGTVTSSYINGGSNWAAYKIYNNGIRIGTYPTYDVQCSEEKWSGTLYFSSIEAALFYGYKSTDALKYLTKEQDTYNICGTKGRLITENIGGNVSLGKLKGISSNEEIKYSLSVPNSTNIWNSNNTYSLLSTAEIQTIPMKANIKSSENPTHRMSPDTYQDTLTVILTY